MCYILFRWFSYTIFIILFVFNIFFLNCFHVFVVELGFVGNDISLTLSFKVGVTICVHTTLFKCMD